MGHQCEISTIATKSSKIKALLKASFHQNCESQNHNNKPSNYFCWDCRELKPFCEVCKEIAHSNHIVNQVFRASRTNALRVQDAKKLFDIAETQPHINNSREVIYLYTRSIDSGSDKRKAIRTDKSRCQNCGYEMTKDGYKFCSIQCQNQHWSKMIIEDTSLGLTANEKRNIEEEIALKTSLRKRSRKGIPFRAPFY